MSEEESARKNRQERNQPSAASTKKQWDKNGMDKND